MQYKAYIFDYDYTLAFSEPAILMCFHYMFEEFGIDNISDEDIVKTIGMPLNDAIAKLSGINNETKIEDMRSAFHLKADEVMNPYTVLYEAVVPMFIHIRQQGGYIGVVSNKLRRRITQMFEMHGLIDYIDVIIGPEDVSEYKPNPEGLLLAIDRLKVTKQETLYVGDNIIDALTAKNTGVDFIGVTTGSSTKDDLSLEPNVKIIQDLSELFN